MTSKTYTLIITNKSISYKLLISFHDVRIGQTRILSQPKFSQTFLKRTLSTFDVIIDLNSIL